MKGFGGVFWLNRIVLVGVLAQIYAAGMAIWGMGSAVHQTLGWLLLLMAIALVVLASLTRRPELRNPAALGLALMVLQPVFVFGLAPVSGYLGALHPLNGALLVLVLTVLDGRVRRITPAS